MCGHKQILAHVRSPLHSVALETTDDGKFTLLTMECLGACDFAPCALVNEKLHENLTIEKLENVINSLPG
jgi:NADH:ubiquinone oxidoreductase subunit E